MPAMKIYRSRSITLAAVALFAFGSAFVHRMEALQHIETSSFNQSPLRPKDDPKVVERGRQLFQKHCQSCHAADLRGTDNGPNILRSQIALTDHHGELLIPVMHGEGATLAKHKFPLTDDEAAAVAAYVRSVLSEIGSQGRPPGDYQRAPDILIGNAEHGKQYFDSQCTKCHSAEGDLKGFGRKVSSPKLLQAAWLRGTHLGVTPPPVTATVTRPGQPVLKGEVIHIDDFILTLKLADGSMQSIRRNGALPKVAVTDPLDAHRAMWPQLLDKDIHDVTAYLVTLK